jgi:hypothetical protein
MKKVILLTCIVLSVLVFAASVFAAPPFTVKQIIVYDGYLQQSGQEAPFFITADTLFVVNNANKVAMPAYIEVYTKKGNEDPLVFEGLLYNGGQIRSSVPPNGYLWITLGMAVNRATHDPWGFAGGEKFHVKISTGSGDAGNLKPTIVEVKQVIYSSPTTMAPGEAIWQAGLFKTWAEAALGGRTSPGLVKSPLW